MEPLHSLLLRVGDVELRWNVVGVDGEGNVDAERFAVHLFTVDMASGRGGFDAPIDVGSLSELYAFLEPFVNQLGTQPDQSPVRVVEATKPLDTILALLPDLDQGELVDLLESVADPEKLTWLATNLQDVDRTQLEASLRQARRERELELFATMVAVDADPTGDLVELCSQDDDFVRYRAGKPETVFQRWFEANTWVLGREYVRRHPLRVIGLDSEADLILETTDGYLDLFELKRPRAGLLNHKAGAEPAKGFHYPHSDLSLAYGQCVRYLADLETFRLALQEEYGGRIVAPRVVLIAGRSAGMSSAEADALRRITATFHQIELVTFDQVFDIGRQLVLGDTHEGDRS